MMSSTTPTTTTTDDDVEPITSTVRVGEEQESPHEAATETTAAVADSLSLVLLYQTPAVPCVDRAATVARIRLLLGRHQPPPNALQYGIGGPTVLSELVAGDRLVLGIDEAGRGSLLGGMVYGMAYWSMSADMDDDKSIPSTTDFGDSKQLTEQKRDELFARILTDDRIGFGVRVLSAAEISRNMLRSHPPYNLNQMSHDATIELIRSVYCRCAVVAAAGGGTAVPCIDTCYIDTVGNPQTYQKRLEQEFPGVTFVVESKADDKYPPCSAASIGTFRACHVIYNYSVLSSTCGVVPFGLFSHPYPYIMHTKTLSSLAQWPKWSGTPRCATTRWPNAVLLRTMTTTTTIIMMVGGYGGVVTHPTRCVKRGWPTTWIPCLGFPKSSGFLGPRPRNYWSNMRTM
jgi:ribonuclease HII